MAVIEYSFNVPSKELTKKLCKKNTRYMLANNLQKLYAPLFDDQLTDHEKVKRLKKIMIDALM